MNKLLRLSSLFFRLREVLDIAEDLAVDIPKVYEYFAELLSPIIILDNDRQRKAAVLEGIGKAVPEELKRSGKGSVLISQILRDLSQNMVGGFCFEVLCLSCFVVLVHLF